MVINEEKESPISNPDWSESEWWRRENEPDGCITRKGAKL